MLHIMQFHIWQWRIYWSLWPDNETTISSQLWHRNRLLIKSFKYHWQMSLRIEGSRDILRMVATMSGVDIDSLWIILGALIIMFLIVDVSYLYCNIQMNHAKKREIYFSVAHHLRNPRLSMFDLEWLWDEWHSRKFPKKRVSEDKTCWKVLCWFVGLVIDLGSRQSWFSRSWKWLSMEDFDRWRILTNKDVEWSVTTWSVIVWEPSKSQKSRMLHVQPLDPSHSSVYLIHSCIPSTRSLPGVAFCLCLYSFCTDDHSPPSSVPKILH